MQGGLAHTHHQRPTSSKEPTRMVARDWRRRSADVGGLNLATQGHGQGQGWLGGDSSIEQTTVYAEMLSSLYHETINSVNDNSHDSAPSALPVAVKSRLIHSLDRWYFEPRKLPDNEVLACTLILFETLFRIEGMAETISIGMDQITPFIFHLRGIYRRENSYHNFEHALDVLQSTHCYLKSAGMVPPTTILLEDGRLFKPLKDWNSGSLVSCLGLREIFILYIAAIGHDVGHPGFSNAFMENTNAPLSVVFDHSSALEHLHYQLLLLVMKHHGLGVLLDDPKYGTHLRAILRLSVIMTDMKRHDEFLVTFKALTEGEMTPICLRQVIICQAILKNADISNPSRPFHVSAQWAKALIQEWFTQADLEQEYDLTPTVMSSSDPLKEANSQIGFIARFVRPLLELTVKAIPETHLYLTHCKSNLKSWQERAKILQDQQKKCSNGSPNPPIIVTSSSSTSSTSSGTIITPSDNKERHPSASPSASASSSPLLPPQPSSPRSQIDSFMNAFPLALPVYSPRNKYHGDLSPPSQFNGHSALNTSLSPSQSESEQDSNPPDSPSGDSSDATGSPSLFSPVTETSSNGLQDFRHLPNRSTSSSSLASMSSNGVSKENGQVGVYTSMNPSINGNYSDTQHLTRPQAAIRAASRLGSLKQRRNKDVPMGPIALKDVFISEGPLDEPGDAPFSVAAASLAKLRKGSRNSWSAGMTHSASGSPHFYQFLQLEQQHKSTLSPISSASSSEIGSPAIPTAFPNATFTLASFDEDSGNLTGAHLGTVSPCTIPPPVLPSQIQQNGFVHAALPHGRKSSPPVKLQALQVSSP